MKKGEGPGKKNDATRITIIFIVVLAVLVLIIFLVSMLHNQRNVGPVTPSNNTSSDEVPVLPTDPFIVGFCTTPHAPLRGGIAQSLQRCDNDTFLVKEIGTLPSASAFLVNTHYTVLDICQNPIATPGGCSRIASDGCSNENLCKPFPVNCTDLEYRGIVTKQYCGTLADERAAS